MGKTGEEYEEYESDVDEGKSLLRMRREAASDDEESEGEEKGVMDRRVLFHLDESDGEGGAAEYDSNGHEYGNFDEEELVREGEDIVYGDYDEGEEHEDDEREKEEWTEGSEDRRGERIDFDVEARMAGLAVEQEGNELEDVEDTVKKGSEPFAVPVAGAFYMHDDRFRDNSNVRYRRMYGGRKLWESKDDKKWGHDKFEELTLQERQYDQGRKSSRGYSRTSDGRNQVSKHGYVRRNMLESSSNDGNQYTAPKKVRGRGPRKYESVLKHGGQRPPRQNKRPGNLLDKTAHASLGKSWAQTSNPELGCVVPAKKQSGLNSASPPFYPSGSSAKDRVSAEKRRVQAEGQPYEPQNQAKKTPSLATPFHSVQWVPGRNHSRPAHAPGQPSSPRSSREPGVSLAGKGKSGDGGSSSYTRPQLPLIMAPAGNMIAKGDHSFPPTPAFLPIVQFGNQHSGGIGVPALGMAFPGYVSPHQLGLGNSEMTWLPVLAGAAGALRPPYCSPYIGVDSAYHAHSAMGSLRKENESNKQNSESRSSHRSELVSDESVQLQNTGRSSEMACELPSS